VQERDWMTKEKMERDIYIVNEARTDNCLILGFKKRKKNSFFAKINTLHIVRFFSLC
jgi:hypothetical protein